MSVRTLTLEYYCCRICRRDGKKRRRRRNWVIGESESEVKSRIKRLLLVRILIPRIMAGFEESPFSGNNHSIISVCFDFIDARAFVFLVDTK